MSWQMKAASAYLRATRRRPFTTEDRGRRLLAKPKGSSEPPRRLAKTCDVTVRWVNGFRVYAVRDRSAAPAAGAVVYLHGGAYTSEIVRQHWAFIADMARQEHEVHVPIYGLAPEHHGLEALDLVTAVVTELSTAGHRVHLIGDSAGGGLALLAAQAGHAIKGPADAHVVGATLIAPWLDLTMANPEIPAIEQVDPWLVRPGLRPMAAAWAGELELDDPRLSPLFGDLSALPPLSIWVGTHDITVADCRLLRDRLPDDVPLDYHEVPGAVHVLPLLPVPEGHTARAAILDEIRTSLRG